MWLQAIKLHNLMTVVGAAVLLSAWLIQQTYLQNATDRLSKLNSAKTTAVVLEGNRLILQAVADANGADWSAGILERAYRVVRGGGIVGHGAAA